MASCDTPTANTPAPTRTYVWRRIAAPEAFIDDLIDRRFSECVDMRDCGTGVLVGVRALRDMIQPEPLFADAELTRTDGTVQIDACGQRRLYNYIYDYFRRLLDEGKVCGLVPADTLTAATAQDTEAVYPAERFDNVRVLIFHTGLFTPLWRAVLAVWARNSPIVALSPEGGESASDAASPAAPARSSWVAVEWMSESQLTAQTFASRVFQNYLNLPYGGLPRARVLVKPFPLRLEVAPANFLFTDEVEPAVLGFDARVALNERCINVEHMLGFDEDDAEVVARRQRLPEEFRGLHVGELAHLITAGVELVKKMVIANPRIGVPSFYRPRRGRGVLQLLIPICLSLNPDKWEPHVALALSYDKDENAYRAHTLLSLDMARNHARLIMRVDQAWVLPAADMAPSVASPYDRQTAAAHVASPRWPSGSQMPTTLHARPIPGRDDLAVPPLRSGGTDARIEVISAPSPVTALSGAAAPTSLFPGPFNADEGDTGAGLETGIFTGTISSFLVPSLLDGHRLGFCKPFDGPYPQGGGTMAAFTLDDVDDPDLRALLGRARAAGEVTGTYVQFRVRTADSDDGTQLLAYNVRALQFSGTIERYWKYGCVRLDAVPGLSAQPNAFFVTANIVHPPVGTSLHAPPAEIASQLVGRRCHAMIKDGRAGEGFRYAIVAMWLQDA